jgi:hypothetical protein
MSIIVKNLAIAGYRSFGKQPQYFDRFAKVNIFIGQNNTGKSNVLRFLHEVYANAPKLKTTGLDPLAYHFPDRPQMHLGLGYEIPSSEGGVKALPQDHVLLNAFPREQSDLLARCYGQLLAEKAKLDGTSLCWTLLSVPDLVDTQDSWRIAVKTVDDSTLQLAWLRITQHSGGGRKEHWEPRVIESAKATVPNINCALIPAIRRIGETGSTSEAFDGTGIIERLAKLQNPDVLNQEKRQRFSAIQDFLCDVVNRPDARIEIPYERNTILVHMDGKVLPIESLGSGIHEVLILAAAATVLSYINWWLSALESPYVEGIHYSIMFYGGRLAAHLSNSADTDEVGDFISLRHLNRRSVMILDSDKDQPNERLNATKVRLKREFDSGPGHAWITDGREIENYLEPRQVNKALAAIHPSYAKVGGFDKYEQMLALKSSSQVAVSAAKVEIARFICEQFKPQLDVYDLKKQLLRLQSFIADSNPSADV